MREVGWDPSHKKAYQLKCQQLSESGLDGNFHFCLFLLLWLHNTYSQTALFYSAGDSSAGSTRDSLSPSRGIWVSMWKT